ncbi:hypothetical protein EKO27_g7453 [Xylaria grammica]|uniref:Uncharacterized protein n=1 Tax=Xylaria grammica TaxID=363999 RepID=A0A439CZL8_9PEZI|nr:hypothetical protein EKO27_g7453 [Xylaria grammica]
MALGTSPVKPNTIKRPIEHEGERETPGSTKRRRVRNAGTESLSPRNEKPPKKEPDDTRRLRSTSPEDFSVFDNSTIENSQVTAISEPDLEITAAPAVAENRPRQRGMTREEARQVNSFRPATNVTSYLSTMPSSFVTKGGEGEIELTSKNQKDIRRNSVIPGSVTEEE